MLATSLPGPDQNPLALEEHLAGTVERVTFHNDETGFCVLQIRARGYRRPVTVVGQIARIAIGESVRAQGAWQQHPSHGAQFRAGALEVSDPTSPDDLCRFLGSGLIKGVGPALAKRLVASFGAQVLAVMERNPDELARVPGIGLARSRVIADAWTEHRSMRELSAFLAQNGIPESLLTRIYRAYGREAIGILSENPYRLALDLPGFTFEAADRIARIRGVPSDAPIRLRAGVASILAEAVDDGHCGLPLDEMLHRASHALDVPVVALADIVDRQCAAGELVAEDVDGRRCLFSRGLYGAEAYVAARLRELSAGPLPWGEVTPDAVAAAEAALGVRFSQSQRTALDAACRSKVLVVTGGPGVGKTTLVRGLLHVLADRGVDVALCAPTGRAARRLSAVTGFEARTIHRLIGAAIGGYRRGSEVSVACDLLVVDEASMVDVRLMAALLRALPDRAALLVVGDADQLPSIGPGQVLADLIGSKAVPVVRLEDIFRQEAESRIVTVAHAINRGEIPDLEPRADSDFYFVEAAGASDVMAKLVTLVRERIPRRFGLDPIRDVQVLCPVNRGVLGAYRLNADLQAALNPPGSSGLVRAGCTFGIGDKVMQARNDYDRDVSNGELGLVRAVDPQEGELTVAFDDRLVTYAGADIDELALAYATTIHKAQGSEYPAVVIPVVPSHAPMLRRSLLYTGITRGSRLVVLVGSRAALHDAVGQGDASRRWSRLEACLRG